MLNVIFAQKFLIIKIMIINIIVGFIEVNLNNLSRYNMDRNLTIDNLRGFAFLLMVFQHIFYFYDVSTNYTTHYANIDIVEISGSISRNLFILLAGYSVFMSYKKDNKQDNKQDKNFLDKRINRSLQISEHALLITIVTYLLYPDKFIKFGILNFLALGTLLVSFIASDKMLTFIALLASSYITYPISNTFLDIVTGSKIIGSTIDWFPLNKWLPVLLSGLVIGQNFDVKIPNLEFNNILTDIGKNSLNLYTGHLIFLLIFFRFL